MTRRVSALLFGWSVAVLPLAIAGASAELLALVSLCIGLASVVVICRGTDSTWR